MVGWNIPILVLGQAPVELAVSPYWRLNVPRVAPTFVGVRPKINSPLRHWRERRELTVAQLAEVAGTTPQQISKLELGQRQMTVRWMTRLAPHLGIDPCDLFPRLDGQRSVEEVELLSVFRRLPKDERERLIRLANALTPSHPPTFADSAAAGAHALQEPSAKYRR